MKNRFVDPDNAYRIEESYERIIKKIDNDGACPFCLENLKKYHKNPIIEENDSWIATDNMYPYEGAKFHVIFISKKHLTDISEISPQSWLKLQEIVVSISKKLKIKGGTTFMRFGDTKFTGASVAHIHAHLISPHPERKKAIMARVG